MEEEKEFVPRTKPNILVAGTPGVGKTTFSKLLSEYVEGLVHINLSNFHFKTLIRFGNQFLPTCLPFLDTFRAVYVFSSLFSTGKAKGSGCSSLVYFFSISADFGE